MCGFTGYHYLDSRRETGNKAICNMLTVQKHRGPDDSGIVGINTQNKTYEVINFNTEEQFKNENVLILIQNLNQDIFKIVILLIITYYWIFIPYRVLKGWS